MLNDLKGLDPWFLGGNKGTFILLFVDAAHLQKKKDSLMNRNHNH